jgi:hypothetical protein
MIDELGTPNTYNHYPTGWAVAFSTPYRMFKRYTYQGGVCDPLVISWPTGIKARGEVRDQYHHCTDIVPTILDVCGVSMPDVVNDVEQHPFREFRCDIRSTPPTRRRRRKRVAAQRHDGLRQGPAEIHRNGVQRAGATLRAVHLLPRHQPRSGTFGGQHTRGVVQGAGRHRDRARNAGRDLRAGFAFWRPRTVCQGRQGPLRAQLPRYRTDAGARGTASRSGPSHRWGELRQGTLGKLQRILRHRNALPR